MDVLSEILRTLELSSQLYFRVDLGAPFAIAVPAEGGVIRFHAVSEGTCVIGLPGGRVLDCGPGDLVLVPHGAAHEIADARGARPKPLDAVLSESPPGPEGRLRAGGAGPRCVLVCGHFGFGGGALHPILATLPPLLHVPRGEAGGYAWIEQLVRHLEVEMRAGREGHREVLRRLSEVLLIEVLRASMASGAEGALSALADPQLGRAIEAMHAAPDRAWSLEALARIAGLSRTLLAERFRARLGTSPMRYLARWRVEKARWLLANEACSVAEAAARVGYRSESAFHRAFRSAFGQPPRGVQRAA